MPAPAGRAGLPFAAGHRADGPRPAALRRAAIPRSLSRVTLHEFIGVWQAQPFRAFRLHTARGAFDVAYPLGAGLLPSMRIAVVADGARVETFSPGEVVRCEITGEPLALAAAIGAVSPDVLGRDAQLLAAASAADTPDAEKPRPPEFDAGTVTFVALRTGDGVFHVQAGLSSRDGALLFNTIGTRWNLHGVETFENGTSLFLHHLDHPTEEQRLIFWPPNRGTFESFAEATSITALTKELLRRDNRLSARPAPEVKPGADYFRSIQRGPDAPPPAAARDRDGEPQPYDPERHKVEFVPTEVGPHHWASGVRVVDAKREETIFDLTGTLWDAEVVTDGPVWKLSLRRWPEGQRYLHLELDVWNRTMRIEGGRGDLPLHFVERHLQNLILHERWEPMLAALRAGPQPILEPELTLPLGADFHVELWPGDVRWGVPFLQPRFLSPDGRTLLDLRGTTWAAMVQAINETGVVGLRFVSSERENSVEAARLRLAVDLVSHRVTCRGLEGSTSLGMLQGLVRRVRGVKWMLEEIPQWMAKGRRVPVPDGPLRAP